MSALTTNEDDAPVTFEVLDGSERVSETMAGVVRGGVAAVVWKSPLAREDGRGRPQISAPRFRATHPQTPAEVVGPWPELEEVEVLKVVESVDVVRARAGGVRLVARDGSYDHLEPFANLREASPHHIALRFVDVPLDAPLDVVLETGDFRQTMVESVTARALEGACGSGEQCHELPPRTGPPTHSLDDLELDDDATVDEARDDDPLEIEFPSGAAAWLDDEPDHGAVQHGSASP